MVKDWKERLGIVYSTNPEFQYQKDEIPDEDTLPPEQQNLIISLDKKQRKGKSVTLISGFVGQEQDLKELGKKLKVRLGVGGSVKNGKILIQGDLRDKAMEILKSENYQVKRSGG
jgi:translation initiation factor 1